jgi:hypothetical protein
MASRLGAEVSAGAVVPLFLVHVRVFRRHTWLDDQAPGTETGPDRSAGAAA